MKQIFNWTVGSFFRTIGRTIAVLMLGGLFYYILSTNGFEFGIKDLFFERVNASTYKYSAWYGNSCNGCISRGSYVGKAWYGNYDVGDQNYSQEFIFTSATNLTDRYNAGAREIIIGVNYANDDYGWWESDEQATSAVLSDFELPSKSYTIQALYSNNGNSYNLTQFCQLVSDDETFKTISCPLISNYGYFMGLRLIYQGSIGTSSDTSHFFGYNRNFTLVYDSNSQMIEQQQETNNAITNQTQQQQQQHNETMNYLQESNTTQAESDAEGFFGNFTTPDVGGLSAIITAPLNTIRSLLNSQCTNLVLPLPFVDEDITLPCMNDIYTQHFGAFFTIYQTIVLALIAYRCIRSIFFDIHGFTNPDDDRIEVMDL